MNSSNNGGLFRPDWAPVRDLTGSLREQLTAQLQDRQETVTLADAVATTAKTWRPPSTRQAVIDAFDLTGNGGGGE